MKLGRLAAFAAVLFVVMLVVRAPASLLVAALPPTVALSGVSGTLWSGQTANLTIVLGDQRLAVGQTQWKINPLRLLTGGAVNVQTTWGQQRVDAILDLGFDGSLRVSDTTLSLDVGWLRQVIPLYVAGNINADIETMAISPNRIRDVAARVVWEDAAWRANGGDILLGTYVVDMTSDDDGVRGEVITLKGALSVAGTISIEGDEYDLSLDLTGPAIRNEAFQQSIALMATPSGAGYRIKLTGTL